MKNHKGHMIEISLKESFTSFSNLFKLRLTLEAMDQYYHEDIIQIENNGVPLEGKSVLQKLESDKMKEVHSFSIDYYNTVIDEAKEKVWGEIGIRYDHRKSGKKYLKRAFYQKWDKGKIVKQKFYFGLPIDEELLD